MYIVKSVHHELMSNGAHDISGINCTYTKVIDIKQHSGVLNSRLHSSNMFVVHTHTHPWDFYFKNEVATLIRAQEKV